MADPRKPAVRLVKSISVIAKTCPPTCHHHLQSTLTV
jgi:hypothetical protein